MHKLIRTTLSLAACCLITALAVTYNAENAMAHTPNPIACQIAWENAPVGQKHAAKVVCQKAQARHKWNHQQARIIAVAYRKCRLFGSGMGRQMCRAIAKVRPAWAGNAAYHELLRRESTWNPNAVNDSSDACGAFQRLVRKPHKNGGRGCPWAFTVIGWKGKLRIEIVHATALEQTRNGVGYILGRYGSPEAAVRFHNSNGYY